jgi:hypothetical protein
MIGAPARLATETRIHHPVAVGIFQMMENL